MVDEAVSDWSIPDSPPEHHVTGELVCVTMTGPGMVHTALVAVLQTYKVLKSVNAKFFTWRATFEVLCLRWWYSEFAPRQMDSDFLSEYRSGTRLTSSLNEINSRLKSLEDSISTSLSEYHQYFRPVASKIAENAAALRILQTAVNELSSEYHIKIKPHLANVEVSMDDVAFKGPPAVVHSQAVQKLEELLKLQSSLQHLLSLHDALEALDECTVALLRACKLRNKVRNLCHTEDPNLDFGDDDPSDDDQVTDDGFLVDWKSDIPISCGAIEPQVAEIVGTIKRIESLLEVSTFYEKSKVALFQAFMGTFFEKKRILRDFVNHYWTNMVRITPKPKEKSILGEFELIGKTEDLRGLVTLADSIHEAEKLVPIAGKKIWETIFLPWLNSISSGTSNSTQSVIFNVDELNDCVEGQELWRLRLLLVEDNCHSGLDLISESCKSLKSTMEMLSAKFFGLKGGDRRLIDFCRSSPGPYNRELAEHLVEGCFLPNLSSFLTSTNGPIVEIDEKAVSKILSSTEGVISPLLITGRDLGYFDTKTVEYLEGFVGNLYHSTVQRQDQVYTQSLVTILSDEANLFDLNKVGGCGSGKGVQEDPKEIAIRGMSESELEKAELSKLLRNVNLEFPECSISKAAILLLKQVDQIIEDAKSYERDQITVVLKRVPRLIHLYSHLVPTLHSERMKSDLRFVSVYYNDCMYLAHQCLTLGRCKIFPLVESLELGVDLQIAASLSTLHLVTPLRNSATSALMDHLCAQKSRIHALFNASRGLKECAGEGNEACEKAILSCISLLLTIFKSVDPLPITIYLRFLGVLSNEFVRLICDAVINLEDITTMECSTLLRLIDLSVNAITDMFKGHLEAAFAPCYGSSLSKSEEKNVNVLLERRIASWQRLQSLRTILSAASLEEVRSLVITPSGSENPRSCRCYLSKSEEVPRLVRALFRPSNARSALLKELAETS
ncbi:hypothetical protein Aperf_G00000035900 [Anoplocephala perfoliata]